MRFNSAASRFGHPRVAADIVVREARRSMSGQDPSQLFRTAAGDGGGVDAIGHRHYDRRCYGL
jgi:hypothetical protein